MEDEKKLANDMVELLQKLRASKPTDRSEKARSVAVTITEFEKMLAYYKAYVVDGWTL